MQHSELIGTLQKLLDDASITLQEQVQSLWSGYGQIVRLYSNKYQQSFIAKVIAPEPSGSHPRGWNTQTSHQRKLKSYQVEACFYRDYAKRTDEYCRVPQLIAAAPFSSGTLLVMDDLDALGFSRRFDRANLEQLKIAVRWLAFFHGQFMGDSANGLWPIGTYWHLGTRQDEWHAMPEGQLKAAAKSLDDALNQAKFKTLVHGDAKLENLCFHENDTDVAAVDFQYIGQGAGVKDLAYLLGSALDNKGLNKLNDTLVDEYIKQLFNALDVYKRDIDKRELEKEIRALYPIAWADFHRFVIGWNPNSWKISNFMQQITEKALAL